MPSVLIVCTANRCRSPMGMAILREIIQIRFPGENWKIESAGTWTQRGLPALDVVQKYMATRGNDLSSHRSRPVTGPLLRSFQLILTMERGQMEALKVEFPDISSRVFLVSDMPGIGSDVIDPRAKTPAEIKELGIELDYLINQGLDRIIALAHLGETSFQSPLKD
jgi:protein-tyrosine-phosphatase